MRISYWSSDVCSSDLVSLQEPDIADRASLETDRSLELRTRDRERKLISMIDAALRRIEENSYGYCEETGEPISLLRPEARPIAILSIDSQDHHDRIANTHRDARPSHAGQHTTDPPPRPLPPP